MRLSWWLGLVHAVVAVLCAAVLVSLLFRASDLGPGSLLIAALWALSLVLNIRAAMSWLKTRN